VEVQVPIKRLRAVHCGARKEEKRELQILVPPRGHHQRAVRNVESKQARDPRLAPPHRVVKTNHRLVKSNVAATADVGIIAYELLQKLRGENAGHFSKSARPRFRVPHRQPPTAKPPKKLQ
jgi:hypothetical protein